MFLARFLYFLLGFGVFGSGFVVVDQFRCFWLVFCLDGSVLVTAVVLFSKVTSFLGGPMVIQGTRSHAKRVWVT